MRLCSYLVGVANPLVPDSPPEVCVSLSCPVVPQHRPAGEQWHTQSRARLQQHPREKWWAEVGTALGHCWQAGWWHGFGNLEKNVGLEQRGAERALCHFCEDLVVMQGKQSWLVCTRPPPAARVQSVLWLRRWGSVCHRRHHAPSTGDSGMLGEANKRKLDSIPWLFFPSTRQERGRKQRGCSQSPTTAGRGAREVSDLGDGDGLVTGGSGRDFCCAGNLWNSSAQGLYILFCLSKKSSFSLHGASVKKQSVTGSGQPYWRGVIKTTLFLEDEKWYRAGDIPSQLFCVCVTKSSLRLLFNWC